MSDVKNWTCPFCSQPVTITSSSYTSNVFDLKAYHRVHSPGDFTTTLTTNVHKCPNPNCNSTSIDIQLSKMEYHYRTTTVNLNTAEHVKTWKLSPEANIKKYPDYIPTPLIQDYEEAARIINLSPKASATISRRCLQGMIRSFFGISKARLIDEINAIEDKIEPDIWSAIDGIRRIGNIGAHMEKDINVIIDVDENEAQTLIELLEMLFEEWFIARHNREQKLKKVLEIADSKKSKL